MADPFVAEIRVFPFTFAPRGWAWCNGQLLPLSQNTALFSLLGTTYGGNGKSNFALPDLQGRAPMHPGQGPGLSQYDLGQSAGSDTVTLLEPEMPAHNHVLMVSTGDEAETNISTNNALTRSKGGNIYAPATPVTQMAGGTLPPVGGNNPHNNMMPYLAMYFCIALQGVFPPRG